jgi:predicted ATPase
VKLHAVYARFYRSLNYDFVRASGDNYEPDPWDGTPKGDYPFVRVKLRSGITTVVGANESGKSQVLRAIEAALTGTGYDRSDFCRYSRFFGVDKTILKPEFGAVYRAVTPADARVIEQATGLKGLTNVERVAIFRMNDTPLHRVYVRQGGEWTAPAHLQKPSALADIGVPTPFRIDADVPLPDSVPIGYLAHGESFAGVGRQVLRSVWDKLATTLGYFEDTAAVTSKASEITALFRPVRKASDDELRTYSLASDLLMGVAGLRQSLFVELQEAVKTKNGYANSIVDTINAELARALDFKHWWTQDSQFELFVSLYEFDLLFMIRDRTGRTYGFDERSDGLKYFLSYFVQYLSHKGPSDGRAEVLLMDEPDRFLSSSGQQDLLRVFADFADPKDPERKPVQVVYVTHSPFLIDKNDADGIRVLEKGEYDEGTRVVTNSSANHYEPLRSAFGSFVAETTFIGNCNLMVEGASDQVLIAGASRWLHTLGVADRDRLDLNQITIVPAGGTRHIPYLVYLARGRDVEKPPVVVLLDNDKAGEEAKEGLAAGGAYGSGLIDPGLILQLGKDALASLTTDNPGGITGIEDLVPLGIALLSTTAYCKEFVPSIDPGTLSLDAGTIFPDGPAKNKGTLACIENAVKAAAKEPSFHLDKVAFARATVDVLTGKSEGAAAEHADLAKASANMKLLLSHIALRKRQAERAESIEKISSRINRIKRDFTRTRHGAARREEVLDLIEEISSQLDASPESEDVRLEMRQWHYRFGLDGDPRGLVEDFPGVVSAIQSLAYQAVRKASR